jgi:PPOX class probable F420-dependent enzyme
MPKTAAQRPKRAKPPATKAANATSPASDAPQNVSVGIPHVPAMYRGKNRKTFLPWSHAEERLVRSRNYWICTSRPDGRPHSSPVWGFWHDGAFYFGTHVDTRKARNIRHQPRVSVHLESGDDVVILEGVAEQVDPRPLATQLDAVCREKYGMPMMVMPDSLMFRVRPHVVLAWTEKEFPQNSTRWEFPA